MIAFDTDVLTEILLGNDAQLKRASAIPLRDQCLPIIVVDEIMRGRLNIIRQGEAEKTSISLSSAYSLFEDNFKDFRQLATVSYTDHAETLYRKRRGQGIRVTTHDLRIAAIRVAHSAQLVSRNRRDFEKVPGLSVAFGSEAARHLSRLLPIQSKRP